MAAATVLRLQTIVSRELAPTEAAVVTIGALQAGTKENVIPEEAIITIPLRPGNSADTADRRGGARGRRARVVVTFRAGDIAFGRSMRIASSKPTR
jgi:acetylornithine deacetylase/succinyl-diaminopimelate desuccinylase-like protein